MENPNETKLEKDQETIQPEGQTTEEGQLAEKDLNKVAGGIITPRDPQSGLPTG